MLYAVYNIRNMGSKNREGKEKKGMKTRKQIKKAEQEESKRRDDRKKKIIIWTVILAPIIPVIYFAVVVISSLSGIFSALPQ